MKGISFDKKILRDFRHIEDNKKYNGFTIFNKCLLNFFIFILLSINLFYFHYLFLSLFMKSRKDMFFDFQDF